MFGSSGKGRRDRPSGAWRDRFHDRAHPASLYLARPGLARRLRLRELLGGGARQDGRRAWRRRIVAAGSVALEDGHEYGNGACVQPPLPLWERSDRIDRCDPGEGLRSIDRPEPLTPTLSHRSRIYPTSIT